MNTTATTRAARYATTAADEAATALACFQAAADLPHRFELGAQGNARFNLTIQGIKAVNRSREAAALAAGQAYTHGATATTVAYSAAASTAHHEAQEAQDDIQHIDRVASMEWRRAQREANTDGSFAHYA